MVRSMDHGVPREKAAWTMDIDLLDRTRPAGTWLGRTRIG